ncbi:hypothetical protein [Niallia sp. FSL W8-0954]|uniref:hypothetical protein n=1 Tax=Niallia sp. FSL W8-0954 TaxID=2975338 RepID=UPI0030F67912
MLTEVPTLEEIVDDHEGRIKALEDYQKEQEKLNQEIKTQLLATENTVLKESGKQQGLVQKLLDHVLEEDKEDRKSSRNNKTYTQQQIWKIAGVLAGSGGLFYLLLEKLLAR